MKKTVLLCVFLTLFLSSCGENKNNIGQKEKNSESIVTEATGNREGFISSEIGDGTFISGEGSSAEGKPALDESSKSEENPFNL
ncbi:hypothetical protein N9J72_02935 [Candidatus Gracilibacteria bacterium]|nr:hypothetical protein [Candidatus Gracilibacteria bacterium]